MQKKVVQKRMPANTTMETKTFLNNKKIDGELYAYLQSVSYPENGETIVVKKNLPPQTEICKSLGIKSTKTYRSHLQVLFDEGYVMEENGKYILPDKEDMFLFIPLETLRFLKDTMQEHVVKIYIYLVQRCKYKKGYIFTTEEIAEHIGLRNNYSRTYELIKNCLICLENNGLIEYVEYYDGQKPVKKILDYSLKHSQKGKN